ncbi:MAG: cell wall-binding repeat-containing protein [Actinomycetota bacterium]|nr:cell wall-binding repeat-containing protein [Actinomycetota bacterium]
MRQSMRYILGLVLVVASIGFASQLASATDTTDIVVIGGSGVISVAVMNHLSSCTDGEVRRVAGNSRYATAAAVSKASFASASTAYVATGLNFPDALAAGPVAAADGAPILLVRTATVPSETIAELDRLAPASIVILGGSGAVSADVENALKSRYPASTISRIAGSNRYETAALISRSHFEPDAATAYIAVGTNFPDALAGGVAAAVRDAPVLLTASDMLPASTALELDRLRPQEIVILGGAGVVSPAVEAHLSSFTSGTVRRLAGPDRFSTGAVIALDTFPDSASTISITTGLDFPDALASTPAATGPLLLASDHAVHAATASAIARLTGLPCSEFEEDLGPILAIGDSVMAGASKQYAPVPNLESEIPNLTVDADVSRPFSTAKTVLAPALVGSNPPSVVVIHLGTNGPPTSAQVAELMAVASDVPRVLFVTVKLDKYWESTTNAVIRANVPLYANAELVDWWARADPHPEWFSGDVNCGCHLWNSTARSAYISLISSALES